MNSEIGWTEARNVPLVNSVWPQKYILPGQKNHFKFKFISFELTEGNLDYMGQSLRIASSLSQTRYKDSFLSKIS